MTAPVAVRWVVSGRVQGVGFRWFVQTRARAMGIRGWARNQADGSVEVVAVANPETLAEFERVVRQGPAGAEVSHLTAGDVPHEAVDAKLFTIKS